MKRQLVKTKDQSPTLFVPELDVHYHSTHGALQESLQIYISAGLEAALPECRSGLHLLEIGFGTGLNAWLSQIKAEEYRMAIHYHGLEKYPVLPQEVDQLNYAALLDPGHNGRFNELHSCSWSQWHKLSPFFSLKKEQIDFRNFQSDRSYDLIYFDAFAPAAQPHLWSHNIFAQMFKSLKCGGLLVTYCVKGEVRRTMQAVGFDVEKLPGPPGKREIARARKPKAASS